MNRKYAVYLSGPGSGVVFKNGESWRRYVIKCFPPHVVGVSPLRRTSVAASRWLTPADDEDLMSTHYSMNGRNQNDVCRSDAVLVNLLGTQAISIEAVSEMAAAHELRIPIIVAIEPYGNIHEHPILEEWMNVRARTLNEAIEAAVGMICQTEAETWTNIRQVEYLASAGQVNSYDQRMHSDSRMDLPSYDVEEDNDLCEE